MAPLGHHIKRKIPDAFRVYCYAVVLKKNTSPVKDANWFNAERNFK